MRYLIRKYTTVSILLTTITLLTACNSEQATAENINSDYSIMVLSDIHISNDETKDNRLADIIEAINNDEFKDLDLLVMTGDNVSSFHRNRNEGDSFDNNRAAKLIEILSKLEIPYYIALGNHDYKIDGDKDSDAPFSFREIDTMEVLWNKFAGIEPYYAFDHKGWNYIILNSMRGRYLERFFDDDQINFLKNELAEEKPSLIFFHHPIKSDSVPDLKKPKDLISPDREPDLFKVLDENKNLVKGIFEGHVHRWLEDKLFGTIPVYMTDSFADNEKSPYHLVEIDTTENLINVKRYEFIKN